MYSVPWRGSTFGISLNDDSLRNAAPQFVSQKPMDLIEIGI